LTAISLAATHGPSQPRVTATQAGKNPDVSVQVNGQTVSVPQPSTVKPPVTQTITSHSVSSEGSRGQDSNGSIHIQVTSENKDGNTGSVNATVKSSSRTNTRRNTNISIHTNEISHVQVSQ
jgi:hypothetical protein